MARSEAEGVGGALWAHLGNPVVGLRKIAAATITMAGAMTVSRPPMAPVSSNSLTYGLLSDACR
jgi:hypothetical protein